MFPGAAVKANDVPVLVVINQISPIYVTFSVPEQHLNDIKALMAHGTLPVEATPPDDTAAEAGTLSFVDNAVDPTTGTIELKGTFANEDRRLWPGQFVNVVVKLSEQEHVLVVPSAAVQTGQQGAYVFVVKPDMTVEVRDVTVGRTVNGETEITKGVAEGDTVVTDGQIRLVPGCEGVHHARRRPMIARASRSMNLSALFIRRPVTTTLIMLAIVVFGVMAYRSLPVSDLPNVDFPTIQVTAGLPGASPETMASAVATPLEKQFSTIAGLDSISSTSSQGSTQHHAAVRPDRNIDAARPGRAGDDRGRARQLPPDMPAPPSFRKVEPGRSADPVPRADLADAAALAASTSTRETIAGAAHLDGERRGAQVQVVRRAEVRRARRRRPARAGRARRSASTRSAAPSQRPTSTCRPGTLYGPRPALHRPGRRPAAPTPRSSPTHRSSPTATARPCGSTRSRTCIDGVENDKALG